MFGNRKHMLQSKQCRTESGNPAPSSPLFRLQKIGYDHNTDSAMVSEMNLKGSHLRDWARFPLRLIVGFGFTQHGFAKVAKGIPAFAEILHALGVPAPHTMALLTVGVELIGGLCVLLGVFIPVVNLPMAVLLVVAIISVHLPYGFSSIKLMAIVNGRAQFGPPGYECNLLYLACLFAVVIGGPTPLSLTSIFATQNRKIGDR